jgi:hypothetical protein
MNKIEDTPQTEKIGVKSDDRATPKNGDENGVCE